MNIHHYSKDRSLSSSATGRDVCWIGDAAFLSDSEFGRKASNLCWAQEISRYVPTAFAINKSLVTRVATNVARATDLATVREFYDRLVDSGADRIIVRSSSCLEGQIQHSFAGLFQSIHNVTSFEEMLAAVAACHISTKSAYIMTYTELHKIRLPSEHLGVIVQREINIEQSALVYVSAKASLIETFANDFSNKIKGSGEPHCVVRHHDGEIEFLKKSKQVSQNFLVMICDLALSLENLLRRDRQTKEMTLEVASDGHRLHVLQLNLADRLSSIVSIPNPIEVVLLQTPVGRKLHLGFKAAAMSYFGEKGMFAGPLHIFEPSSTCGAIEGPLRKSLRDCPGITVRYSYEDKLALPREFFRNQVDVLDWVKRTRRTGWTTIIHPYIDVRHSFEILVTENSFLLEHVPGIWESDNVLDPDVLLVDDTGARLWRRPQERLAQFSYPEGIKEAVVKPIVHADFRRWIELLAPILKSIRADFRSALPLNFHFVEDDLGRWSFLNLRRGFGLGFPEIPHGKPHVVSEERDIESWDGRAPLLMRFATMRGSEGRLLAIAKRLPRAENFPVLVDFGLLSHPAMILRELGFVVVPSYMHLDRKFSLNSYEFRELELDTGVTAVERIRKELPIYLDKFIRVLPDREPIVPGHLLVVSEERIKSFADGDGGKVVANLISSQLAATLAADEWIFVERGRATFCTSGFTDSHAHAHLLPAARFRAGVVAEFADEVRAKKYFSLLDALQAARDWDGEYILISKPRDATYLSLLPIEHELPKRFARKFFESREQ